MPKVPKVKEFYAILSNKKAKLHINFSPAGRDSLYTVDHFMTLISGTP